MKLQSKNYEILNKQKLRKKIYIYLPLTCFLFRNSLTTIYSRTIISSSSGMSCKSSVSKIAAEFSPFVFLPLSTRAYFKGRAYIKIILKNHARSYFAGRSYYRGSTVPREDKNKHYLALIKKYVCVILDTYNNITRIHIVKTRITHNGGIEVQRRRKQTNKKK